MAVESAGAGPSQSLCEGLGGGDRANETGALVLCGHWEREREK